MTESKGAIFAAQGSSSVFTRNLMISLWSFKWKLLNSYFMWYCLIMLYKVVLTSVSLWIKPKCVTIWMKTIEQFFHVVLFIMLYKVVLTFKSVGETLVCDHSNESYWVVLSFGTINHIWLYIKKKTLTCTHWVKPIMLGFCLLHKAGLTFKTWVSGAISMKATAKRCLFLQTFCSCFENFWAECILEYGFISQQLGIA